LFATDRVGAGAASAAVRTEGGGEAG
jgi:hypothetical protein